MMRGTLFSELVDPVRRRTLHIGEWQAVADQQSIPQKYGFAPKRTHRQGKIRGAARQRRTFRLQRRVDPVDCYKQRAIRQRYVRAEFSRRALSAIRGYGAIGTWLIELPATFRQFDYGTIADVILHLHYTARDGGSAYRTFVENVQRELLNEMILAASRTGLFQAYSLRQQFPNEWGVLKQAKSTHLTIGLQHLPFFVQGHTPAIDSITWFARVNGDPSVYVMSVDGIDFNLNRNTDLAKLYVGSSTAVTIDSTFTLAASDTSKLEDLTLLVHYTIGSRDQAAYG